jgi:hypothetical protein
VILPSVPPKQLTESASKVTVIAEGSVIVVVALIVHPLASVIVTRCGPEAKPVAVCVVCPLSQMYE